jgi:hypothetical protein
MKRIAIHLMTVAIVALLASATHAKTSRFRPSVENLNQNIRSIDVITNMCGDYQNLLCRDVASDAAKNAAKSAAKKEEIKATRMLLASYEMQLKSCEVAEFGYKRVKMLCGVEERVDIGRARVAIPSATSTMTRKEKTLFLKAFSCPDLTEMEIGRLVAAVGAAETIFRRFNKCLKTTCENLSSHAPELSCEHIEIFIEAYENKLEELLQ